jgi:hypothetical protein
MSTCCEVALTAPRETASVLFDNNEIISVFDLSS